jgi:hypothetical protein
MFQQIVIILWIVYIGNVILAKMLATVTEYVLALATLGSATRNRNYPICVILSKVAKARTMVSVACRCHRHYCNKLRTCKQDFNIDFKHNELTPSTFQNKLGCFVTCIIFFYQKKYL